MYVIDFIISKNYLFFNFCYGPVDVVNRVPLKTPAVGIDANLWQETAFLFIFIKMVLEFDMSPYSASFGEGLLPVDFQEACQTKITLP
jgi:hypothetical protein